jgi:hypothetical protein
MLRVPIGTRSITAQCSLTSSTAESLADTPALGGGVQ